MKKSAYYAVALSFFTVGAQAGSFYFPIEGHYPYSPGNNIEAVPDLDNRTDYMKSRMNEKGNYWNGYNCSVGKSGLKRTVVAIGNSTECLMLRIKPTFIMTTTGDMTL